MWSFNKWPFPVETSSNIRLIEVLRGSYQTMFYSHPHCVKGLEEVLCWRPQLLPEIKSGLRVLGGISCIWGGIRDMIIDMRDL